MRVAKTRTWPLMHKACGKIALRTTREFAQGEIMRREYLRTIDDGRVPPYGEPLLCGSCKAEIVFTIDPETEFPLTIGLK